MSDTTKWANATSTELYNIAKGWAERFSLAQLRGFQDHYTEAMKQPNIDDIRFKEMENRWQCATYAISIKTFGY